LVFLVVTFPMAFPPKTYTRYSSPPFVLHDPPVSSSSTWLFWLYLAKSTNHEVPRKLLAYADDVNLLRGSIDTIKKNTETLIYASKEVGLEINVKKTKYILLYCQQNVGRNREIKITNMSFGNVSQFKYLGTTVQIRIWFGRKLRGDWILVMLATIRSRTFYLLDCCQKTYN
jgi:hypothetical protein